MKKLQNNRGFALAETLIGAVFVMAILIVLFENYYPLVGKYERYENYDDLDSKYIVHYLRAIIEVDANKTQVFSKLGSNNYYEFKEVSVQDENIATTVTPNELCTLLSVKDNFNNKQYCQNFISEAGITKIYLTKYATKDFKNQIKNHILSPGEDDIKISRPLELYVDYIPTFIGSEEKENQGYYRLLVEIKHEGIDSDIESNVYYSYANIEVQ